MKKLKLKLSETDAQLLQSALYKVHAWMHPSGKEPGRHWAEPIAAFIAYELSIKINRAMVVEQETYSFKLSEGEALVVRQAMLMMTSEGVTSNTYHASTYRTILHITDQALT